jgi:hypothetical protein
MGRKMNNEWREKFHKQFVQHYLVDDIYNFFGYGEDAPDASLSGKEEVDKVIDFIEQEIDKAREEGYEKGLEDMGDWIKGEDSVPWEEDVDEMIKDLLSKLN